MDRRSVKRIQFHYLDGPLSLKDKTELKAYLISIAKKEGFAIEKVNYIFCDDDYLLKLNRRHLKHSTLTDIITFQFNDSSQPILSDIYISMDRVRENAKTFSASVANEYLRVMFHGILHLCGYKDKSAKDQKLMRLKEDYYLGRFVSRGTKQARV